MSQDQYLALVRPDYGREALDWSDLRWLREIWPRKLMVKGILTAEDALLAAENGADGVFVSNHGGRQLYGASVAGQAGIEHALALLKSEVDRVMALLGCRSVADIGLQHLQMPTVDKY